MPHENPTKDNEMDQHRRKSIQRKSEAIFKKAEDREKAGGGYFETGWQATLELMLLMMEEQLFEDSEMAPWKRNAYSLS